MKQVNRIFLILLWIEKINLELRLNQVNESSVLPDFTIQILTNHLGPIRKMSIVFSDYFVEDTKIIQGINVPLILNAEEKPLLQGLDMRDPCEVVIVMEKPLNVSKYLKSTLWTSDTLFILTLTQSNSSVNILLEIFENFWAANVINVFVLVTTYHNISVYSYHPFALPGCDSIEVLPVDKEALNFNLRNQARDLHGCQLNVSVVDLPPIAIFVDPASRNGTFKLKGVEAKIVHEVAKKFNFVPKFAVAKDGEAWGWIHPQPHGVVGEVFLKQSHFGIGLLATTLERYECLDMTVPVSPQRECITWAVPVGAAKTQALWLEIYVNEFSRSMWLCLGVVFALVGLIFWRVSKAFSSSNLIRVIIFLYSSFIFVPVKSPHRTSLRSLFISWVWGAFIVMISYQTLMGSKLTVPVSQRDIETIRDLLDSDLHFTGFYNTFRLITYEAEGDLKKVEKRLEPTTYGIKEAIVYIVVDRNVAYLRETTSFQYFSIINPQAKGKVHFMKECAYEYYPIMVLQRKSPLTWRTNQIIGRLLESGILLKWRENYIYSIAQPPPPVIKLTLYHMLAPFIILLVGICVSAIVFTTEVLSYSISKKIKRESNY